MVQHWHRGSLAVCWFGTLLVLIPLLCRTEHMPLRSQGRLPQQQRSGRMKSIGASHQATCSRQSAKSHWLYSRTWDVASDQSWASPSRQSTCSSGYQWQFRGGTLYLFLPAQASDTYFTCIINLNLLLLYYIICIIIYYLFIVFIITLSYILL